MFGGITAQYKVPLRTIERYDIDSDRWCLEKTMLNTKEGVLGSVCAFETLVYIMRSDCCVVEVFDT